MQTSNDHPTLPGHGDTDYERYLRVPELLSLQKAPEQLAHRDEMLFQVEHQSAELWFKLILFDLGHASRAIDAGQPLEAERLLQRGAMVLDVLRKQLLILGTMAPWDYHEIRRKLGRGSGAESPGFRALQMEPRKLWPHFQALLQKRGTGLEEVYVDYHRHYDLFRLAEALTDFDMAFQLWRLNHLTFIQRVIGRDVRSLKGYSVHDLEDAVKAQLFPELWAVRNTLTHRAGTSPSYG